MRRSGLPFYAFVLLFLTPIRAQEPTLIFPQIADGGGITFELTITNPGTRENTGVILLKGGNGQPLPIFIGGVVRASLEYTVPAGGTFKIRSDGLGGVKAGYALVHSESRASLIAGSVVYSIAGKEVSVPSSPLSHEYHVNLKGLAMPLVGHAQFEEVRSPEASSRSATRDNSITPA
jgi:hypothetical protein